jgi:oxygen-independent coproporphyrinogen-3 oxidase
LHKTIALEVPHISSYALTVEPKTALENWISKGKVKSPKEEEQNRVLLSVRLLKG